MLVVICCAQLDELSLCPSLYMFSSEHARVHGSDTGEVTIADVTLWPAVCMSPGR
jgi:hypothetical protein